MTAVTLEDALTLIRRIQPKCMAAGWYVALAGGVLNNGQSENDIDLVFMPRTVDSEVSLLLWVLRGELGDLVGESDKPCGRHVKFPEHRAEGTIVTTHLESGN